MPHWRRDTARRAHSSQCSGKRWERLQADTFASEKPQLQRVAEISHLERWNKFVLLAFFRGQFEVDQVSAEASRLDGTEENARGHPDGSDDFCWPAQVQPKQQAN